MSTCCFMDFGDLAVFMDHGVLQPSKLDDLAVLTLLPKQVLVDEFKGI